MTHLGKHFCLVILVICVSSVYIEISTGCTYELQDHTPKILTVKAGEQLVFCLNIDKDATSHVVFEAHVQMRNVCVSLDSNPKQGRFANGTDVGVVSLIQKGDLSQWYFYSQPEPNNVNFGVVVMATGYTASDPIPGGCNQELPLENDPNIYLSNVKEHLSSIEFAYGNIAISDRCGDSQVQENIRYDVYQYFMDERNLSFEHFSDVLVKIMKLDFAKLDTSEHLNLVTSLDYNSRTQFGFAAYPGLGTVYVVVISDRAHAGSRAIYVPTVTYSCKNWQEGCTAEGEFESKIVVSIIAVFGLFICFVGHRFLKFEMFFFGYLATLLIAYILLTRFTSWDFLVCLYVSLGIATLGGILWLLLWIFAGIPVLSVLLVGYILGFLVAGIVYNGTPLGLFPWCRTELNFQLAFLCVVLFITVVLLPATRVLNVLGCAIVGSFFVVMVADICLHGVFKYLFLNTIWRSSIPDFVTGFATIPFQISDILLCVVWCLLSIAGLIVHYVMERKKEPFPERPWTVYTRWRRRGTSGNLRRESTRSENDDDERQPLLPPEYPRFEHPMLREQPVEQINQPTDDVVEWWQLPPNPQTSYIQHPVPPSASSHPLHPPPPYTEASAPLLQPV